MASSRRYLSTLAAVGLVAMLLPIAAAPVAAESAATVPAHFRDELVWSGLVSPTNVAFAPNGKVFVSQKNGKIFVYDSLTDSTGTQVIDLGSDVHNYWDRGLLGFTIDPDYPTRPYIYALYTYNHILGDGAPAPRWSPNNACPTPPGGNTDGCVVSGRLERLTVSGTSVSARKVLITDWCAQFPSHSIGTVLFGPDGALYVSGGDGASFNQADYGQLGGSPGDTITPVNPCGDPANEGGALRSQDVRTTGDPTGLSGSLIRIDPDTGAAWPDNANAGNGNANIARIIAYGMRNPFRFTIRPNGNVWIGDVGWSEWEEIDKISNPAGAVKNFGWPCYEGNGPQGSYSSGSLGLALCASLSSQSAPAYTYNHADNVVGGDGCGTAAGSSISGLAFLPSSSSYPSSYDDGLFFTDYSRQCIWFAPDSGGNPDFNNISLFANLRRTSETSGGSVFLGITPAGDLIYTDYNRGEVRAVRYYPPNTPPTASFTATPQSGVAPLTVSFNAATSFDPDPGDTITYAWDLDGDGQYDDATGRTTSRKYTSTGDISVGLKVTDAQSATDTTHQTVHVGTSPIITWPTPASTLTYSVDQTISFSATATDPQDGTIPASGFAWDVIVRHCPLGDCHEHGVTSFSGVRSGSFTAPDHPYPSSLKIVLSVTDSDGNTTTVTRTLNPKAGTIDAKSSPSGITIDLGEGSGAPPPKVTAIVGSPVAVSAPDTFSRNGIDYAFDHWSDGGARNHSVKAASTAKHLTATFRVTTPLPFTDIANSSFAGDIVWLAENDITKGCGGTKFCPDGKVTRGQMATFLAKALNLPAATKDYFTDDNDSPHESNINKLAKAGITSGCAATKFCPTGLVSRAQMASFLAKALHLPASTTDYFTDDESSGHESNINRIAKAGITIGCGGTKYCPSVIVTRGQMAAFLHRALGGTTTTSTTATTTTTGPVIDPAITTDPPPAGEPPAGEPAGTPADQPGDPAPADPPPSQPDVIVEEPAAP